MERKGQGSNCNVNKQKKHLNSIKVYILFGVINDVCILYIKVYIPFDVYVFVVL